MSYQALYRKWRPGQFDDVKGQEHIVTTLKNQLVLDRVGHAYLFCGTRGTGKTTVAKLFAKAVNCLEPVDGSPCNECTMCKAINNQSSMNVIEIDAASNNGVDNIREIRDEVAYSPAEGKYKVYIIDEVHMLSIGAFNALLKTLEEPPSYVIFILATTEAHKIPITILSRCQRYDFRRITIETIADRLRELAAAEELDIEDKALLYIAKAADGSLRDALSLLDQCIAFYIGQKLTYDNVLEVLGAVDTTVFSKLLRHIIGRDTMGAIYLLEEIIIQGRELTQFVSDFVWYLRNLLLLKNSEAGDDILEMSSENLMILKEEAEMIESERLMRYIRIFSELASQMRYSTQKRVLVEVALIKLCKPVMERNYDSILDRLALLESRLEEGVFVQGNPGAVSQVPENMGQSSGMAQPPVEVAMAELEKALSEDVKGIIEGWGQILSQVPMSMEIILRDARLSEGANNQLILGFEKEMHKSYFDNEKNKLELQTTINSAVGKAVEIMVQLIEKGNENSGQFIDPMKVNLQGVDFVFEDE